MALPLGTLPAKGLLLQVLPAGSTLLDLLQDRRDSQFHAGVRTWARWLAKLHDAKQGCEALPIRLDSELRQDLTAAHQQIVQACPSVRGLLDSLVEDLHLTLSASPNPLLPTLGSSNLDRLHFHQEVLSPIDFQAAALGDPAADIGMACADLELAVLQATNSQDAADRAVDAFVSEYRRHGGAEPFGRIGRYRAYRHVMQIGDALTEGTVDPQQISLWLARGQSFLAKTRV
jgi:aminoglycoside phosphotransferase (APT) family kinase protein